MNIEFTTNIARVRHEQRTQLQQVREVLHWTHSKYCWHQFEMYVKFFELAHKQMPYITREMSYSPVIRGFWNDAWVTRNEEFLEFAYESKYNTADIMEEYLFIHSFKRLVNDDDFMKQYDEILRLI